MRIERVLALCIVLLGYSIPSFSAVLNISNSQLTGATGITVGSAVYDVSFVDDSCINIFDGCDETSDFFFTNIASGHAANLALLEQVLVDSILGDFDSNPALTNGCYSSIRCLIQSPIGTQTPALDNYPAIFLVNRNIDSLDDYTGLGNGFRSSDFGLRNSNADTLTYAVWSNHSVSEVPVPAAIWLLGSGLLGLFGMRNRKNILQA